MFALHMKADIRQRGRYVCKGNHRTWLHEFVLFVFFQTWSARRWNVRFHVTMDEKIIYPGPGQETPDARAKAESLHRQIERLVNEGGAAGEGMSGQSPEAPR